MNRLKEEKDIAIVVSPMRRTIQTALLSLDWLIAKGVAVEVDADWQGRYCKPIVGMTLQPDSP
jgi:broad specificity phosphatase PhoE